MSMPGGPCHRLPSRKTGSDVATQQKDHLGDILKGAYTGNAQTDDYYYELVKPAGR